MHPSQDVNELVKDGDAFILILCCGEIRSAGPPLHYNPAGILTQAKYMRDRDAVLFKRQENRHLVLQRVNAMVGLATIPAKVHGQDLILTFDIKVIGGSPTRVTLKAHHLTTEPLLHPIKGALPCGLKSGASLCRCVLHGITHHGFLCKI